MSKTNVPIVKIDTDPAKKSLKDLRKALKDFKDEMANLEEGSDEFLEVANKAGEVKHQIDEINESIKGASSDFGDLIGNVTNVAAGITGAFQAVAGGLQAIGVESKAIDETIARMQGLMAITQGLSAIDDGIKSFGKLKKSIEGSTAAMRVFKTVSKPAVLAAIVAVVVALGAAWNKWGDSLRKSLPWLDKLIKKFDGTAAAEVERMAAAQEKFNEALAVSDAEVAKILEDRKLSKLTQEGRDELKRLQDDLKIAENELLHWQEELNKAGDNKALWNKIREDARLTEEKIKQLKAAITSLYTDPKYQIKDEIVTPVITPTTSTTRDGKIETLGKVATLDIKPIVAPLTEDDKNKIQGIIDDALETAKEERLKKLQEQEDLGVEFFEGLKNSFSDYSDSSLGITSGWIESLNVFEEAFLQTMNKVKESGKLTWTDYTQIAASALGGVGTLLNALSQEQDASNEEGFKKMKQLQIAATTINMLAGITAALSGLFTTKTGPWDIALASIQAATIAATGAAQIAKIKNTSLDRANPYTNINAKSTAGMIMPPTQYSQAVIGSSIEGKIKDTKVYVTETDITNTINKVSVQENENKL